MNINGYISLVEVESKPELKVLPKEESKIKKEDLLIIEEDLFEKEDFLEEDIGGEI